jgi:pimeloyl-ACP methyl ester carboxylesterase
MSLAGDGWVLLHGTPLSPAVWDGVAGRLGRYGPVWCPAVTPAGDGGDATAELAQRLAAGGLPKRMDLVGHSFGGQVALDLALLVPARMRTLTLIASRDTPYPAFAAAASALRRGDPVDPAAALSRWFTAAELSADGPVVRYARGRLERAGRRAWATALAAIARYDRSGRVGVITVPVTLIAAELDPVSSPATMAALAGRLPRASLTVLPGAAHLSPFTDPATLAGLIAHRKEPR